MFEQIQKNPLVWSVEQLSQELSNKSFPLSPYNFLYVFAPPHQYKQHE